MLGDAQKFNRSLEVSESSTFLAVAAASAFSPNARHSRLSRPNLS
jgi:hypothetical protein